MRVAALLVSSFLLALSAVGCGGPTHHDLQAEQTFTESAVKVTASLSFEPRELVVVKLQPLLPGLHLYGKSMPSGGVDGVGVPATVTVSGDLWQVGGARANVSEIRKQVAGLSGDIPVYPAGPISITLPVKEIGGGRPTVIVSFGACSSRICFLPVHMARLVLS